MTKFSRCARAAISAATKRPLQPSWIQQARLTYCSLHEASFITVMDDRNDASQYGYRIFVPSSPKRTNVDGVVTSSNVIRKSSSSAQQYQSFHCPDQNHHYGYNNDYDSTRMLANDDYAKCMQSIDPSTLDILSSPEVLAILESQCDWEKYKNETTDSDDPYLSDCEEMEDDWDDKSLPSATALSTESFDKLPAFDEKKM